MCMYITTCMCVHAMSVTVSLIKAKPANDNTCTYIMAQSLLILNSFLQYFHTSDTCFLNLKLTVLQ